MRAAPRARLRDIAALLSSLISVAGCGLMKTAPPAPPPTLTQIEDATYSGVLEQPVTLQDGAYVGTPFVEGGEPRPGVLLWNELVAFGDLDDTPGDEAAVLLSGTSGGSGERIYLAVVGMRDGSAVNLGTSLVGERVKVRTLGVVDGKIVLDLVEPDEDDAACCPTRLARKSYELASEEVRLHSNDAQGMLSVQTLEGAEWQLVWLDQQALPPEIRAPTLALRGGRLYGFGGCNTYNGSIEESAPGVVTISRINSTRMACEPAAMNLEQEVLQRVEKVDHYTFLAGRLALSGERGDDRFLLLWSLRPVATAGK